MLIGGLGNLVKNKPVRIDSSRFFLPAYTELFYKQGFGCVLTTAGQDILGFLSYCRSMVGIGHLQPTTVYDGTRYLHAYLRVGQEIGRVLYSRFDLENSTWTEPERIEDLPNPDSALDAVATSDGGIIIVYNHSDTVRTPLSLAYSHDGKHFTRVWDFETDPDGDFSYPALIRARDGLYHVTYTCTLRSAIKHVSFDEEWLQERIAEATSAH